MARITLRANQLAQHKNTKLTVMIQRANPVASLVVKPPRTSLLAHLNPALSLSLASLVVERLASPTMLEMLMVCPVS